MVEDGSGVVCAAANSERSWWPDVEGGDGEEVTSSEGQEAYGNAANGLRAKEEGNVCCVCEEGDSAGGASISSYHGGVRNTASSLVDDLVPEQAVDQQVQ
eukprot:220382-Hanusia_phi.AAC.1